jgi:hypothetical protein
MFYNPLLENLSALTDQQLEQKLNELVRKYVTCQNIGNNALQMQLETVINAYRNEIVERTHAKYAPKEDKDSNSPDPFSVIDIQ